MIGIALMAAMAMAAPAQDSAAIAPTPASEWAITNVPSGCRGGRTFGTVGDVSMGLVDIPLTGTYILSVTMPDPITVSYGDPVTVTLEPSGQELHGTAIGFPPKRPTKVVAVIIDATPLSAAGISGIRIATGGTVVARLSVGELSDLTAKLKACENGVLARFGIDPASQAKVATPPQPLNDNGWFNGYPAAALRERAQGAVSGRFTVKKNGSAGDCVVVVSSGSAALDRGTCEMVEKNARFKPALSKDGRPVPAMQIFSTRWVLQIGR